MTRIATQLQYDAGKFWNGDARLYRLSEPLEGKHEHVVVSKAVCFGVLETLVFITDEQGRVTGTYDNAGMRGDWTHADVLIGIGYAIESEADNDE